VLLEEVKDAAIALYSRDGALRVVERRDAAGDFSRLDAQAARRLAERYDLDLLITEEPLDLPTLYRNERFAVQRIR
jgi:hypothetical protein